MLLELDVKEDYYASNIVHDTLLFALPTQVALLNDGLSRFLRVLSIVERLHDFGDLVVRDELPDAITGDHNEFVFLAEIELEDLRLSGDTDSGGYFVTKRAGHGQAWDILGFEPHAQWTDRVLLRVSEGINTAAAVDDASGLVVLTWLLIATDGLCNNLSLRAVLDDDAARVTNVDTEELLAEGHDAYARGAREPDIKNAREKLFVAV